MYFIYSLEMLYSDIPTVVYNQINKDLEYFTKTHN